MVPRRIPTKERERGSSRFRLVNNSVCIKVVARATTTNDYAILFETRLNFPNKVKKVAGLVSSQEKKERDA